MKLITKKDMDGLIEKAAANDRKRTNLNIHDQSSDPIQRLFVAAQKDSYFRPHRHPKTWEFALILKGLFDVLIFDDHGKITDRLSVGPDAPITAFELPAGMWHAWIPMTESAMFFETKQGPYDPKTAAEFAPWSPAEGSEEVAEFVKRLRDATVGEQAG